MVGGRRCEDGADTRHMCRYVIGKWLQVQTTLAQHPKIQRKPVIIGLLFHALRASYTYWQAIRPVLSDNVQDDAHHPIARSWLGDGMPRVCEWNRFGETFPIHHKHARLHATCQVHVLGGKLSASSLTSFSQSLLLVSNVQILFLLLQLSYSDQTTPRRAISL